MHPREAPSEKPKPRCLTLAQMRGLQPPPEHNLSVDEWRDLETKADARGDNLAPCPICREGFHDQEQVILSCSHIFHRKCLSAFERFLRTSERTCPLCRKADYQKRFTSQG
ncbi:unnamed protein product [Choristocarpus tenellus]